MFRRKILKIIRRLLYAYLIFVISAFALGYIIAGLATIGIIPPPDTNWADEKSETN